MPISPDELPTPLAQAIARLNVCGAESSADSFLIVSYVAEVAIKLLGVSLASGLEEKASDHAYRIGYNLVRADGLGVWEALIREAATPPLASFLPPSMNALGAWATKVRTKQADDWFRSACQHVEEIFALLHLENPIPERKPTCRDLISALVQLRNKTRAHGAVGEDFFVEANPRYIGVVKLFIHSCPLYEWRWLHLETRPNGRNRGVWLSGTTPKHARDAEVRPLPVSAAGVHFWPPESDYPVSCAKLIYSNRECSEFWFPNGGYTPGGLGAVIDYRRGREEKRELSQYVRPPAALPPSETEGLPSLLIQSNVFGNLPDLPSGYVERPGLERELVQRLSDNNHPIITLHGRGGIGKTSLALQAAHTLARSRDPKFDEIFWFSARDVDLALQGPRAVRPAVVTPEKVSVVFGRLFQVGESLDDFARALREPDPQTGKGALFIFDNFETMSDTRGFQEFLDTHTHIPNKVLITSRERAFKADFPIEVKGMEFQEACELIENTGRELSAEGIVTPDVAERIYEFSEGHPYIMKILVAESAKEGRYIPPRTLMPKRMDILEAVFERSFNKLSNDGRWVFLIAANWNSAISQVAFLVIMAQRDLDAEYGIEECRRLSLITQVEYADGAWAYVAPHVARIFGRKKLSGDPDRLLLHEDLELVRQFGVLPTSEPVRIPQDEALRRFAKWCVDCTPANGGPSIQRLDETLQLLAELWPEGWLYLARFRERTKVDDEAVEYAYRRAVEEAPTHKESWLARADYAARHADEGTYISCRVRAVEIEPGDVQLIRDVASDLCSYISQHSTEIPVARRSVYLASVRAHMVGLRDQLDPTGLSRLAWLFLLENNKKEAWEYAALGLEVDPYNSHCLGIIDRLKSDGYYGP